MSRTSTATAAACATVVLASGLALVGSAAPSGRIGPDRPGVAGLPAYDVNPASPGGVDPAMVAAALAEGRTVYPTVGPRTPRKPVPVKVRQLRMPADRDGRAARIDKTATTPFRLVGIIWPARPAGSLVARVRVRSGGKWTPWQRLAIHGGHGSDGAERGRAGTEPLWVGRANGVQAELIGNSVPRPLVTLVDPGSSKADDPRLLEARIALRTSETEAPFPMPRIVTRRGWGADESLRGHNGRACTRPSYTGTIQAAFVHHTAGSNRYTKGQSAALVRGVYAYHVKGRGWCDVGYNFLVDKFGQAFEGRYGGTHLPVKGAHTGAFNTNSFGISLMGDFDKRQPSANILEATARVIAWKLDAYYRSPHGKVRMRGTWLYVISGHRDTKSTACPGKYVYYKLNQIRARVSQLMGHGSATEIYQLSRRLGGEARIGAIFWGEHPTVRGGGRSTWFAGRDLYWSRVTGANSVYGLFRTRYRQFGHSNGPLGLPRGEERDARVRGGRLQAFQHKGTRSALYWSRATGAQASYGVIMLRYNALGAETSRLRLPVTCPYPVKGGLEQRFQGGRIRWTGNRVEVDYE